MKALVILVDGMRPDAITNIPLANKYRALSASTMTAQTVMPSATLPCIMSLFHSVPPSRHGTTTNTYAPQVRPVKGLCEVLYHWQCAFFYDWSPLRDCTRPGSLRFSYFCKGGRIGYEIADKMLADAAIDYLRENETDFAFVYMGWPDSAGHQQGWMSPEYMRSVAACWENIDKLIRSLEGEYTVFITADHGGHERFHGSDLPEDMTIPMMVIGKDFTPGSTLENVNIIDIAPTVVKLLGADPDPEWEGKSLL